MTTTCQSCDCTHFYGHKNRIIHFSWSNEKNLIFHTVHGNIKTKITSSVAFNFSSLLHDYSNTTNILYKTTPEFVKNPSRKSLWNYYLKTLTRPEVPTYVHSELGTSELQLVQSILATSHSLMLQTTIANCLDLVKNTWKVFTY